MDKNIDSFLKTSPLAAKIKFPAKIVVHRTKLSPAEIAEIKKSRKYGLVKKTVYELVCGGQVLARGRIISKKKGHYFKINEVIQEDK